MNSRLNIIPAARTDRAFRRPQHPFYIQQRVWGITPNMIAPVLPGDTLTKVSLQARVVTDPVKNAIMGWWCDYMLFYVKHRDMIQSTEFEKMMLDPNYLADPVEKLTDDKSTFFQGNDKSIDWLSRCLQRITETYFREPSEAWNVSMVDTSYPAATFVGNSALDSAALASSLVAFDPGLIVGVDDKITGREVNDLLFRWQLLSMQGLTDQSYDEFLGTYGVDVPTEQSDFPELLGFWRHWQYPTNTVNPASGIPASAVSWVINERMEKNRFFKEPGFLVGVSVLRPKVYFKNYRGTMTSLMNNVAWWLPPVMDAVEGYSLRDIPAATILEGVPLTTVDARDLFMYGEQFTNVDLGAAITTSSPNTVNLPTPTMGKRYPQGEDFRQLFVDVGTLATSLNFARSDGIWGLTLKSRVIDRHPAQ